MEVEKNLGQINLVQFAVEQALSMSLLIMLSVLVVMAKGKNLMEMHHVLLALELALLNPEGIRVLYCLNY